MVKNIILLLAIFTFFSFDAFAMQSLREKIFVQTKRLSRPAQRRHISHAPKPPYANTQEDLADFIERLSSPIIPRKKPALHFLPENFFIENAKDVSVNRLNNRILHIHQELKMENQKFIHPDHTLDQQETTQQFALLHNNPTEQWALDRRWPILQPLSTQYLPICYIHGTYKLSDTDNLAYVGSGFRNASNQVITAGHTLYLKPQDVVSYYSKKQLSSPEAFLFDKELLTLSIIFGYTGTGKTQQYVYLCNINGKHSFPYKGQDLGVVQLPMSENKALNDLVGSLPMEIFPTQPHDVIKKPITIVGYPGEEARPCLYSHTGPIVEVNAQRRVLYEVDTTSGNSGSPGFLKVLKKGRRKKVAPAVLTHTAAYGKNNGGEAYNPDFMSFMLEVYRIGHQQHGGGSSPL